MMEYRLYPALNQGYEQYIGRILLVILLLMTFMFCSADPIASIASSRRTPVIGLPLNITWTFNTSKEHQDEFMRVYVYKYDRNGNRFQQGACGFYRLDNQCYSRVDGIDIKKTQLNTTVTITIAIASVNKTRDEGDWRFAVHGLPSRSMEMIRLPEFATILDWSDVTFDPLLTSLPRSVTPDDSISVMVTTPCADPAPIFSWTYQGTISGVIDSSRYTTTPTSCATAGQVWTTHTLSLPGNDVRLYGHQVSLTVTVEHPSFEPRDGYKITNTSNVIQFLAHPWNITMSVRPQNEHYIPGQLVEFSCTGNLGNQIDASKPDTVWKWDMTSDNSDDKQWQPYPNSDDIRYSSLIPTACSNSNNTSNSNNIGNIDIVVSSIPCGFTGTSSLLHVVQENDNLRHFRCFVVNPDYSVNLQLHIVESQAFESQPSVGLTVGTSLGVCLPVIIGLVIIVIYQRRLAKPESSDKADTIEDRVPSTAMDEEETAATYEHVYDGLQDVELNGNTYGKLSGAMYANTNRKHDGAM